MKRVLLFIILLVGLAGGGWLLFEFYLDQQQGLQSVYVIPNDAIYIIETDEPVDNWEKISTSEVWAHLQRNDYFAELTSDANALDTLFKENKTIFKLLGSRALTISAHQYKVDDYDFLFVLDLRKASKLTALKNYLGTLFSENYEISRRPHLNNEILELYDKESRETLYLAFIENLLVTSYTHILVENAIAEYQDPTIGRDLAFMEIRKALDDGNMFRLYVQYRFLDDYINLYTSDENEYAKMISQVLNYSGFTFELDKDNLLTAKGYTNTREDTATYFQVLSNSGTGERTIHKIAPQRTGFYMSLSFDDFSEFYDRWEEVQKNNPAQFAEYKENYDRIEKFLKIDLRENFIDWIDEEIAFLQMQNSGLGTDNEFAVVLQAKDGETATENLDFILNQIRKKTPVRFKQVTYKGYPINFMSVKGFFKIILGKFFEDLDKPYFTIIDNYVVFSNHPQTIKNIINDVIIENTLDNAPDFKSFSDRFDEDQNLFMYINTPVLHTNLQTMVDPETRSNLTKNRQFITCFSQVGYQLSAEDDLFKSTLILQFTDPETLEKKIQFATNPEKLMLAEFGHILPKIDAEVALSTQTLLDMVEDDELISIQEISPDDLDDNLYVEKFENGNIKIEVPLKNGVRHGTYREYFENGNIKVKGKYRNDVKTGWWKVYNEEGKTLDRQRF